MPAWQHFFIFSSSSHRLKIMLQNRPSLWAWCCCRKHLWCKTETVRLWMETCRHRSKDLTWASPGGAEPIVAFQCFTAQCGPPYSPPCIPIISYKRLLLTRQKSEEKERGGKRSDATENGRKMKKGKGHSRKKKGTTWSQNAQVVSQGLRSSGLWRSCNLKETLQRNFRGLFSLIESGDITAVRAHWA